MPPSRRWPNSPIARRAYYLGEYLGFEGRPRGAAEMAEADALSAAEFGSQVHALLAGAALAEPDSGGRALGRDFPAKSLGETRGARQRASSANSIF